MPQPERPPTGSPPLVVLDVEYVRHAFVLVLANVGQEVAFRPRVRFSEEVRGAAGAVSDLPIWTQLGLLAPGRRVEVFLDSAAALLGSGERVTRFTATVSYADAAGREAVQGYDHDLAAYAGLPQLES